MVGNPQSSDSPSGGGTDKPTKARVKSFDCPNCGGAVLIRTPGLAMSAVCGNCKTVIDVTNNNFSILRQFFAGQKNFIPSIELGTRGKLRGRLWEVIGFMVRADKASGYQWEEYLLFNPYYGYRWLTQGAGHWNLVTTIKSKPQIHGVRSYGKAELDGRQYRIFYEGEAEVRYVMGEFYWRVRVDNTVKMTDYICPPYMLSSENDHKEIVWARSEYIEPKEVVDAFNVTEDALRARSGIAPNQVSKNTEAWREIWKLWLLFIAFLTIGQFTFMLMSTNKTVYSGTFTYQTDTKVPELTTPTFTLAKDRSNVKLDLQAPVSNSWFYIDGELVNNDTGESFPFDRSIEYYYGYEDGESWSEGSTRSDLILSYVPKGTYYLNLNVESGQFQGANSEYSVSVVNDVPTFGNYFWSLFFVSILPIWQWFRSRRDEVARWSQSDFSPYQSYSSD